MSAQTAAVTSGPASTAGASKSSAGRAASQSVGGEAGAAFEQEVALSAGALQKKAAGSDRSAKAEPDGRPSEDGEGDGGMAGERSALGTTGDPASAKTQPKGAKRGSDASDLAALLALAAARDAKGIKERDGRSAKDAAPDAGGGTPAEAVAATATTAAAAIFHAAPHAHASGPSADPTALHANASRQASEALPASPADMPNGAAMAALTGTAADTIADVAGARLFSHSVRRIDVVSMRTDYRPETLGDQGTAVAGAEHGTAAASAAKSGWQGPTGPLRQIMAALGEAQPQTDADPSGGDGRRGAGSGRAGLSQRASGQAAEAAAKLSADGDKQQVRSADGAKGQQVTPAAAQLAPRPLLQQAVSAVLDAVNSSALQAGQDGRLHLRAGGAGLKTVQIQLQPEQMGKLDVTMRLVGGQLSVHLLASNPDTALKLKEDSAGLRKLLEKAGFSIDDAAVTIAAKDPGAARQAPVQAQPGASGQPSAGGSTAGGNSQPGMQGGASGNGAASQGGAGGQQQRGSGGFGGREPDGEPAGRPAASGVYV